MSCLGNILWFFSGSFFSAFVYYCAGIICYLTIIGIPVGNMLFSYGSLELFPFGKEVETRFQFDNIPQFLGNLIWLFLVGWTIVSAHLVAALICAITIIGIPFALQHLKLAQHAFWPFGSTITTVD